MKNNLDEFEIYKRYQYAFYKCRKFFDISEIKCFIVLLYDLERVWELDEIIKQYSK